MPARWQQWMPLHIDRWRGSPAVRAMHPCARSGYLELMFSQWQTDDCALPGDPMSLAECSGLGDELWAIHSDRILRNFEKLPDGRLRNPVCFEEWNEAKRVFEARRASADRTNTARSPHGHRTVTDGIAPRSADTHTLTGTGTGTVVQKQIPSPKPRKRVSEDGMKHSSDPRHLACKEAIFEYYRSKNQTDPPWNGMEGKALGMLLGADPHLDAERIRDLLRCRYLSEVNHADRPGKWLGSLHSYANGPLDKFGKPDPTRKPKPKVVWEPVTAVTQ